MLLRWRDLVVRRCDSRVCIAAPVAIDTFIQPVQWRRRQLLCRRRWWLWNIYRPFYPTSVPGNPCEPPALEIIRVFSVRMKADVKAISSGEDDVHYRAVMVEVILVHECQQRNGGNARPNDLRRSRVVMNEFLAQGTVFRVLHEVHTVARFIPQVSLSISRVSTAAVDCVCPYCCRGGLVPPPMAPRSRLAEELPLRR